MVASRKRPKGASVGPFGLSVLALTLMPTQIGYQDLAALLVRQQDVSQRARAYALASPFGTIHAATFSFPRPVGTRIPEEPLVRLASLHGGDITGSLTFGGLPDGDAHNAEFPVVNRRLKGDRLVAGSQPQQTPQPENTRDLTPGRIKTVSFTRPHQDPQPTEKLPLPVASPMVDLPPAPDLTSPEAAEPLDSPVTEAPAVPKSFALASLPPVQVELPPRPLEPVIEQAEAADPVDDIDPIARAARLYFGGAPVGKNIGLLERWPGEEPVLLTQPAADPEIKRTALARPGGTPDAGAGQTIAPKGEVTGPDQRPKSPAERLGLNARDRAKAEKCLAEAVYFESRGEPKRGQIAVAQVVMNRVFSGYYPNNVCEVVYQNAHRYNACQFTFACDSVKDVVNDPPLWKQAMEIARDTLDGKVWLEDIGKSTHYHAYWVHPWWVGTMRKLSRIGVHTFYRPKRWGDGAEAPIWGQGIAPQNARL